MRETGFVRWAAPVGALVTLGVGYAWCALVLGWGGWPSLGAGMGSALLVFGALALAASRCGPGPAARGRVLGIMTVAGFLMLVAGLLVLLLPGIERGGLLGGVALVSAAVYFGAALYEFLRGRGSGTAS